MAKAITRAVGDYARIGKDELVYLTKETISFNSSRPDFKNLALTDFSSDKIEKVVWTYGEAIGSFTLFKKKSDGTEGSQDEWYFDEEKILKADKGKVDMILGQVASIRATSIMKQSDKEQLAKKQADFVATPTADQN